MNSSEKLVTFSETGLVSDAQRDAYGVALSVVSSLVCSVGILANILNICVFFKQGITDSVTISLLVLAFSDLGSVLMMFGVGVCFSPLLVNQGFAVNTFDLSYMFGWAHNTFMRISFGMTAFVSFERCLCIAVPLKVKSIITIKRTIIISITIIAVMVTSVAPVFYSSRMEWTTDPDTNTTIYGLVFTDDRELVDGISFIVNTVLLIPGIFIATVTFTIILVVQLKRKAKWRDSVSSAGKQKQLAMENTDGANGKKEDKSDGMSSKERRVVKMVVFISCISIVCYSPGIVTTFAAVLVPDYNTGRKEENILFVTGTFTLLLQAVNSTVNIFVYLKMSSKFKTTFDELMASCICKGSSMSE